LAESSLAALQLQALRSYGTDELADSWSLESLSQFRAADRAGRAAEDEEEEREEEAVRGQ
jgi:hypothetical protein